MLPVLAFAPLAFVGTNPATSSVRLAAFEDFDGEYEDLLDAYNEANDAWFASYRAADANERDALRAKRPPLEFVSRFSDLAKRASDTPVAVDAWTWVFAAQGADKDLRLEALDTIVLNHMASPKLESLVSEMEYSWGEFGRERIENALLDIQAGSDHDLVLAASTFMLGNLYMAHEEADEALSLFREVRKSYGKTSWGSKAERFLFEAERLQVGMIAPDFEAVDQDGVAFKLSDYRGKVVLLDFWGFW
ncbi:MAG: hypothetical protein ACI835_004749 [Planctomycetota bacterium]|jgi:hypothetical protein